LGLTFALRRGIWIGCAAPIGNQSADRWVSDAQQLSNLALSHTNLGGKARERGTPLAITATTGTKRLERHRLEDGGKGLAFEDGGASCLGNDALEVRAAGVVESQRDCGDSSLGGQIGQRKTPDCAGEDKSPLVEVGQRQIDNQIETSLDRGV
jgi:hypothetical protein